MTLAVLFAIFIILLMGGLMSEDLAKHRNKAREESQERLDGIFRMDMFISECQSQIRFYNDYKNDEADYWRRVLNDVRETRGLTIAEYKEIQERNRK